MKQARHLGTPVGSSCIEYLLLFVYIVICVSCVAERPTLVRTETSAVLVPIALIALFAVAMLVMEAVDPRTSVHGLNVELFIRGVDVLLCGAVLLEGEGYQKRED